MPRFRVGDRLYRDAISPAESQRLARQGIQFVLFHSLTYAALLTLTLLTCCVVAARHRWLVLLVASFTFYFAWRPEYLGLLLLTTVSCHFGALVIGRTERQATRRNILLATVAVNLAILFLFKYYGLFASSLNRFTGGDLLDDLGLLLPVGISFYTFQAIGYVTDVYERRLTCEKSLARTTLFIAFFPQLVAGPIERARRLMPALRAPIHFRWRNLRTGSWLILWGLFKKVVIADRLSLLVNSAYLNPGDQPGWLLALATYAFAFQIYCDFSGYSDMAIGSAKLFGIELMQNFRNPYLATSLRDFWSRWHISLSTWFRDYVYLPLGGNRVSHARWCANIMVVFAISGLWHGAQWTYVIWGILHGFAILVESACGKFCPTWKSRRMIWIQWFLTFHVVLLGWIFFRSITLYDAVAVLTQVVTEPDFGSFHLPPEFSRFELAISALSLSWMLLIEYPRNGHVQRITGLRPRIMSRLVVIATLLLILNFGMFSHPTQFVYFQF